MNLINLLKQLKMDDFLHDFDQGEIVKTVYSKSSQSLNLTLSLKKCLPYQTYRIFKDRLMKQIHAGVNLTLNVEETNLDDEEINAYVEEIILQNHLMINGRVKDHAMTVSETDKETFELLQEKCKQLGIVIHSKEKESVIDQEVKKVKGPQKAAAPVKVEEKKTYVPKGKRTYVPLSIQDIHEACEGVEIWGDVFEIETRPVGKSILHSIYLADDDDAIILKRFVNPSAEEDPIKVGQRIRAYGRVVDDSFLHTLVFMADRIEVIEKTKRKDNAEKKRVELHLHTKLSEMDGVSDIAEYIDQAADWGHEAIAITDHLVVQDFPKAQRYLEKINKGREKPIKMIYGVEMNMVDPVLNIVTHPDERLLESARYCIFDLETTGLSSRYDHIIEFGGVIVENREVKQKLQMFIKPPVELSAFTTQLTNITEKDLKGAVPFEECYQRIVDFIGDAVLVAHNASFDVNFLNDALTKIGQPVLKNPVIDTLDLSYSLHADRKAHRLGNIARIYNIKYDEEVAHRADYDAQVLSDVYLNMLNDLKDVKTLNDLANFYTEACFSKVRTKHITVYAKNKAGLKSLFELITLSHTKHLAYNGKNTANIVAEPRIFRSEIEERRENLLLGSACSNGEVFEIAHTRNEEQLKQVISFYDFIELQPLENYRFLIERNSIASEDRLKEILQGIADAAEACGKLIVATGDAHYVQPREKKIRDIYINSQAIGGKRHPLYVYDFERRKKTINPDQHFRSTDEMLDCFAWMGEDKAFEYVVENSNKIASMTEKINPVYDELFPPKMKDSDKKLTQICYENAYKKYGNPLPEIVEKRLKRELDSIIGHGFYVVYYISHLLVKKSLDDGYMVGSRGSVGSSFVATMANITEVNPLPPHYVCPKCHYVEFFTDGSVASGFDLPDKKCPVCGENIRGDGQDIPFETFLGFEGDKVPDIDLNFSGDYQPTAHNYLKEVFGEDHVFRAGTIGTVATQTAFGYVKGYEEEMGCEGSMRGAMRQYLANGCDGVKRTTGQHPGGILVVPNEFDVHDFTPVQYPANNPFADWKTTHFEFHDIHDNLLKFDILGHVDPTAMKLLESQSGIDPKTIPMNDPETMKIFSSVESLHIDTSKNTEITGAAGIPEFGTPFVRGILELTKPTTFDELVRISGLSHGTDVWLNNAKDLIDSKQCTLKNVIGCRDDIMVYLLHKGLPAKMAFTIMESVRKGKGLKPEWIEEMSKKEYNIDPWYVDSCLKIKYMFPKAHAVAYVMMAVRIAWFKVHMPLYYYCMFFSIRCDAYDIDTMIAGENCIRSRMNEIMQKMNSNEYKNEVSKKEKDIYSTLELALEMVLRGYRIGNIDLMRSQASTFIVDDQNKNTIIPPFTTIDGLGSNVAETIIEEREKRPFLSKQDLMMRTSLNGTHIKKLEMMGVLKDLQEENQMSLF